MKLLKHRTASQVAENWFSQYCRDGFWYTFKSQAKHQALCELPPDATAKQIDAIVGNPSWTTTLCICCREYATPVVQFDGWRESVFVCKACIQKAARFFDD